MGYLILAILIIFIVRVSARNEMIKNVSLNKVLTKNFYGSKVFKERNMRQSSLMRIFFNIQNSNLAVLPKRTVGLRVRQMGDKVSAKIYG